MNKTLILAALACAAFTAAPMAASAQTRVAPVALKSSVALPSGVALKEVRWFSEQVEVSGRLFTPAGFNARSNAAVVVIAPGWGKTAASMDAYAAALAAEGMVALTIDYRGWGRSGGYLYLGERIYVDDRNRFSNHTPTIVVRRGRLEPNFQVEDIRNALTFAQSIEGVNREKVGVLGVDMAGGHVISTLGMDARAKAGVAITPIIQGAKVEKKSLVPTPALQAEMIRLARTGAPPRTAAEATARNAAESRIAVAEYMPFWRIDAIPTTDAVLFVTAANDEVVRNADHADAAFDAYKGVKNKMVIVGAKHALTAAQTADAARGAAAFLKGKL